jgi:hypothetical protein
VVRVQKVISLAVGMDNTEFDRAMRKMYSELAKARTATRPLSDSMAVLKEALTKVTASSEQVEIVQNRLTLQAAKRADQIRKEAAAVRELTAANSAWAAGLANTVAANKPFAKGLQGLKDNSNRDSRAATRLADDAQFEADEARLRADQLAAAAARRRTRIEQANRQAADDARFAADEARILEQNAAAEQARRAARRRTRIEQANRQAADDARFAADEARILEQNAAAEQARRAARRRTRIELAQRAQDETDAARANRLQLADTGRGYMSQFNDGRQNARAAFREAIEMRRSGAIDPEQYARAVAGIRAQNNALAQSFASVRNAVTTLLGPLVLVYSAYRAFTGSIKLSAELDEAKAKFRVFTGSAVEAGRILKDVRKLSSESPVSFQGGQRSLTTMLQYGVEAKNITSTLRTLATITGGNTERMESLSLAYAQANAAGFNPLKVISEQTGKSMADLKAEMQDGQISFKMVEQAFKDATRDGGRFNGLLEEIANTTAGKLNRAQSSIEQFGIAFGELIKPATDGSLDLFINDIGRLARSMKILSDSMPKGSLGGMFSAGLTIPEVLSTPSYVEDFLAASSGGSNPFSEQSQKQAEAIKRLAGNTLSEADKKWLDDYLASVSKIKDAIADGTFKGLTEAERAGADFLLAEQERNKRTENKGLGSFDSDINKYKKLRDAAKDFGDTQKAFIDLVEKHGQGRFSEKDIEFYKRAVAEQEKLTAATKEQQRIQAAFKDLKDSANKDLAKARYGDKAGIVGMLQEQATGDERRILNAMIAAGSAYNEIVLAANEEAQAQADSLEAVLAKTKAIEDAAAAEKKAADQQAKFDKEESQRFVARRNKYLADLKNLEEDAKRMQDDANPNSALIEGLAKAQLLRDRGIITGEEFAAERNRLANESAKGISANAAPAIGRGSQEAYQFITGQTVDRLTMHLQEAEKQTLLQTTQVEVTKLTNTKLDELIAGIPEVVGP